MFIFAFQIVCYYPRIRDRWGLKTNCLEYSYNELKNEASCDHFMYNKTS